MEGVFIEQLYDEAKRLGVSPNSWHEHLRRAIPSPGSSPVTQRRGGGGGGGAIDLSQTAPANFFKSASSAASPSRPGAIHRFAMPFSSSWGASNVGDARDELEDRGPSLRGRTAVGVGRGARSQSRRVST